MIFTHDYMLILVDGDTSSFECAHQLGKLCEGRHLYINLIPYNQTDVKDKLCCPSEEHMGEFHKIVTSYGAFCFIRRTMGADVNGACGQLVVTKEKSTSSIKDIEDTIAGKKLISTIDSKIKKTQDYEEKHHESGDDDHRYSSKLIAALSFATGVAASCFVISVVLLSKKKIRR